MADVRGAGPGGRFVLHAQPIVDVTSGRTVRHELFLRMVDGPRLIPAADFVPAAEERGSIREFDRWVMGRALEVAAGGIALAINLSLRSADEGLLELIRNGFEKPGADAGDLALELSEAQLLAEAGPGERFVRGAHELGCRIALDGFIQGGRRAALLSSLPIDFVKLGPPFVDRLVADGRRRRKTRNATNRAHERGQRVIAQGVEDLVTLQLLQDLGIDEAQGYALGRPEPLESAFPAPG
jgi:EAL domain-containing protein (putative c-di-GMP-specific phosphodiesterase class I)